MKCEHPGCNGAIVEDQWEPGKLKCQSCGRRVKDPPDPRERRIMETGKKICSKCLKELPLTTEFFNKNANNKDSFEGKCKNCRKKYFADYRAGKRIRTGPKKAAPPIKPQKRIIKRQLNPAPVQVASPTEILIALRKGMAAEIIAMIEEKYDL